MSFKQQCPSCEERVLIKDVSMVGKKVDCPKCKYRFAVEKPAGAEPEAKPKPKSKIPAKAVVAAVDAKAKAKVKTKPDDDSDEEMDVDEDEDRPKKKKKKDSSSSKLIVWLAAGGVGLILLAVAGFFLLGGGDDGLGRPNPNPPRVSGGPGPGPQVKEKTPGTNNPNTNKNSPELAEPSNHLPRDSEVVLNISVQDVLRSPLGLLIFDGSLTPQNVEARMGLKLDDLERLLVAGNFSEPWNLLVFRTTKPIDLAPIQKKLDLKPADSPIKGQEYFVTTSRWRDFLATSTAGTMARMPRGPEPLAVRLHDQHTLVMGDPGIMTKFLEEQGKPAPQPGTGVPPATQPGSQPPYTTIAPEMRELFSKIEKHKPLLFSLAINLESRGPALNEFKKLAAISPELKLATEQKTFGASIHVDQAWLGTTLASISKDRESSNQMEKVYTALAIMTEDFFKPLKVAVAWERRAPMGTPPPMGVPPPMGFPPGRPPIDDVGAPVVPVPGDQPMEKPLGNAKIEGPRQDARLLELTLSVDLPAFDILQRNYWMPHILRKRGEADLALKRPTPHVLARAGVDYSKKDGQFPRGTLPRKVPDGRFGRPWHPDERVSGLSELLPFLGYDAVHAQIDAEKSWREGDNLLAAMTLIPYFVDPDQAPLTRYVRQPGLRNEVAATHFVGLAGIGRDAAEYGSAQADKLGIWGYDRQTKLADLGPNLATTIFMIQIPTPLRGPWLAGGGATVRGVPEKNSVAPFVARNHEGKPGTFALMADGSVRFIAADIADDVFKALAVVKKPAGIKVTGLPEVPAPKKPDPENPAP